MFMAAIKVLFQCHIIFVGHTKKNMCNLQRLIDCIQQ